jgi:hypothetical protein
MALVGMLTLCDAVVVCVPQYNKHLRRHTVHREIK